MSSFNLTRWRYGLHILYYGVVPPSVPILRQTLLSSATFNTCPPIFTTSAIYPQTNTLYSSFNSDKTIHIMPSITYFVSICTLYFGIVTEKLFVSTRLTNKLGLLPIADFKTHLLGEPSGIRTRAPLIKSQVLYLLSYRFINWCEWRDSNPHLTDFLTTLCYHSRITAL